MSTPKKESFVSREGMLLIGIGLALAYWLIESVMSIFISSDVNFVRQLLGADIYNVYTRIIILCLFVIFGSHVQYTMNNRKKAEEALRESEEKYRNILASIQEGYYEVDTQGNFTFFNDSLCKLFGYTEKELLGMNNRQYMDEKNARKLSSTLARIHDTGQPDKAFDCEYIIRDGSKRFVETSISLITDSTGHPVGFRGVARDMTEKREMEQKLIDSDLKVHAARSATILGLAKLAEYRDRDTGSHLERMREYCKIIALELAKKPEYRNYIDEDYIDDIYNSSILHDIGKVGIPDAILLKPDSLTPEEFEVIKSHARLGGNAIEAIEAKIEGQSFLTMGKEIAFNHHEKWDGSGYPKGLKENDIPLSARIVSLADVYDALTSKRIYKGAIRHEEAREMILEDKGKRFDPEIIEAFVTREPDFNRVRKELADADQSSGNKS